MARRVAQFVGLRGIGVHGSVFCTAGALLGALPFSFMDFQFGMGNEKMPNDRLEGFRMRSDVLRIHRRNDAARVSYFGRVSAVSSHDSQNGCPHLFRVLEGRYEVRTDVLLQAPSPTEKTMTASSVRSRLPFNHSVNTEAQPSSFVLAVSSETLSVGA